MEQQIVAALLSEPKIKRFLSLDLLVAAMVSSFIKSKSRRIVGGIITFRLSI
jgi:hypothetical protein